MKDYFSKNLKNLLTGLLEKAPCNRFGVEEIKKHPFFADTDWDKVYNKQYTPPLKPKVKSLGDTTNVNKDIL
jgi:serine/threonine protein kinase